MQFLRHDQIDLFAGQTRQQMCGQHRSHLLTALLLVRRTGESEIDIDTHTDEELRIRTQVRPMPVAVVRTSGRTLTRGSPPRLGSGIL
ncbi:hypothetical protein Pd630_LPD03854 [Rhodococcus opacus PD630]|nr:hypothetical protein Pd630_LPD03854 [Rhodococcus opacus PD630]